MPVEECKQRISHREYLGWQYHLQQEWNTPSRSDHYIMALTAVVAGMFSKKAVKADDFKIKFTFGETAEKIELTPEQRGERSKQMLLASLQGAKNGRPNRPTTGKDRS